MIMPSDPDSQGFGHPRRGNYQRRSGLRTVPSSPFEEPALGGSGVRERCRARSRRSVACRFASSRGRDLKGFVWAWNEWVEAKKPRVPRPDVMTIRVVDRFDKEALLASDQERFFTEPHYNGFPAILVRLTMIEVDELEELILDAWRCQAPRALVDAFERSERRDPASRRSGRMSPDTRRRYRS
jgi:hypothetical protein